MILSAKIGSIIHSIKHWGQIAKNRDEKLRRPYSNDERLELGHERTGHRNRRKASSKFESVAVGIPLGGRDTIKIHYERTMALEQVRVVLEIVEHGS